jgi:hypothetical protein
VSRSMCAAITRSARLCFLIDWKDRRNYFAHASDIEDAIFAQLIPGVRVPLRSTTGAAAAGTQGAAPLSEPGYRDRPFTLASSALTLRESRSARAITAMSSSASARPLNTLRLGCFGIPCGAVGEVAEHCGAVLKAAKSLPNVRGWCLHGGDVAVIGGRGRVPKL